MESIYYPSYFGLECQCHSEDQNWGAQVLCQSMRKCRCLSEKEATCVFCAVRFQVRYLKHPKMDDVNLHQCYSSSLQQSFSEVSTLL